MKALKILNSVINHLNLLLHNRHPPGKVVVLPDFPGQFVNFGLHNCLGLSIGNQNTCQCDAAGNHGSNDRLQFLTSSSAHPHEPIGRQ